MGILNAPAETQIFMDEGSGTASFNENGMPLADPRMDGLCQILDGKYMDRTRYNLEEVSYDAVNHEVNYV